MKSLLELLEENNRIPMHMPGHKRNIELAPYLKRLAADLDITEIDGFDDLHNPEGILKCSMERAARLRGADSALYLVNGSTCGILAGICATVKRGGKVICARNCHKSVYNALELVGAKTEFVMPKTDEETGICASVTPEMTEAALKKHPDASLIILTSPTYEGVVSDIYGICRAAHKRGVPVMVDAAHGAHFGFGTFPKNATLCGADIVIESLHKTLPSLTQTAICSLAGKLVDFSAVAEKLAVFETSSPSYLLMASIDGCFGLLEDKGSELFCTWEALLEEFYKRAAKIKNLRILKNDGRFFDFDKSKIVILGNGRKIAADLRGAGIECEMAMPGYAVLMSGLGDSAENSDRVLSALSEIDDFGKTAAHGAVEIPERCMPPHKARSMEAEVVPYAKSIGRISAEYVWAYPPGVPIIIPGEKISAQTAELFEKYEECGFVLRGDAERKKGKIRVIK